MARKKDKQKAIVMRQSGMSYSQIKEKLNISKSTLSGWLCDMPLSEKRIRELRDNSPVRIERYRNTMRAKKDARLEEVYKKVSRDIGAFSKRDLFIAGLFLYWGEGSKTKDYAICLTNTNPDMLIFFINWLELFGIHKARLKIHLHLYLDMNVKEKMNFWSKKLNIPLKQFRKPYIKKTKTLSITYRNGFGQGTCSVILEDGVIAREVLMGIKYIQNIFK